MYVRVCSNVSRQLYQSMVYARVNVGWFAQYIVFNYNRQCFELVDELDKSVKPVRTLVSLIQSRTDGMREYSGSALLKYKNYCKSHSYEFPDLKYLFGYPDVCENCEFLHEILSNKSVPLNEYDIELRDLPDVQDWTYLRTQEQADEFMNLFAGFHDSTLERVCYVEDNTGKKEATAIFDNSGWFGVAELCFEGVELLGIVPPGDLYCRNIMCATLRVSEEGVLWADSESEEGVYEGSMIRARSLKWRKIEPKDI